MSSKYLMRQYTKPLPETREGVLEELRSILEEGGVQEVHISVQQPIRYTKRITSDLEEIPLSPMDIARNIQMEELRLDPRDGKDAILRIMATLAQRNVFLTHICYGDAYRFWEWMGFDPLAYVTLETFLGAELLRDKEMPPDSCLFFAGPFRDGSLDIASLCFRCCLPSDQDAAQDVVMQQPKVPS